jgi:long-subunit fatty acid transport protein
VQYEDGWSGRYYGTKAEIITLGAGINGAYRMNDWLSIGGGPFVLYGKLDQRVRSTTFSKVRTAGSGSPTTRSGSAAWPG